MAKKICEKRELGREIEKRDLISYDMHNFEIMKGIIANLCERKKMECRKILTETIGTPQAVTSIMQEEKIEHYRIKEKKIQADYKEKEQEGNYKERKINLEKQQITGGNVEEMKEAV